MAGLQLSPPNPAGIVSVTLDRPPVNALDLELTQQLAELPGQLASARGVVLAGRPGHFSAGLDLKQLKTYTKTQRDRLFAVIDYLAEVWYQWERPVVTAVTGHAMAGGLLLALCGDLRVCTNDPAAQFGLPAVRVGVTYPPGPWRVLVSELGPAARRQLLLAGHTIDPASAYHLGIFDELAPPESVVDRAVALAESLADLPADGYRNVKRRLRGEFSASPSHGDPR